MANTLRCSGCGRFRLARPEGLAARPPCPNCGQTAITFSVHASLSSESAATVLSSLRPGDQRQGWERRWQDIQDEAAELLAPLTVERSGQTIQAARSRIQSFYVTAYHLKDDLKEASLATGIQGTAIETTMGTDPDLALLCDLANLRKHSQLNRPPRSRHIPKVVSWAGTDVPGSPSPGWRLTLVIEHNGVKLDGLELVRRSVNAWRRALQGWNLI